jgi:hypothetical protein
MEVLETRIGLLPSIKTARVQIGGHLPTIRIDLANLDPIPHGLATARRPSRRSTSKNLLSSPHNERFKCLIVPWCHLP